MFKLDEALKGKDLYKLLEVKENASTKEIAENFKKLCVVYHPDKMAS